MLSKGDVLIYIVWFMIKEWPKHVHKQIFYHMNAYFGIFYHNRFNCTLQLKMKLLKTNKHIGLTDWSTGTAVTYHGFFSCERTALVSCLRHGAMAGEGKSCTLVVWHLSSLPIHAYVWCLATKCLEHSRFLGILSLLLGCQYCKNPNSYSSCFSLRHKCRVLECSLTDLDWLSAAASIRPYPTLIHTQTREKYSSKINCIERNTHNDNNISL